MLGTGTAPRFIICLKEALLAPHASFKPAFFSLVYFYKQKVWTSGGLWAWDDNINHHQEPRAGLIRLLVNYLIIFSLWYDFVYVKKKKSL